MKLWFICVVFMLLIIGACEWFRVVNPVEMFQAPSYGGREIKDSPSDASDYYYYLIDELELLDLLEPFEFLESNDFQTTML